VRGRVPTGLGVATDGLLGNLSLLFVPAGVGVMQYAGLIGRELLPISVALVVSTLLTIGVTGAFMGWLVARRQNGTDGGEASR